MLFPYKTSMDIVSGPINTEGTVFVLEKSPQLVTAITEFKDLLCIANTSRNINFKREIAKPRNGVASETIAKFIQEKIPNL